MSAPDSSETRWRFSQFDDRTMEIRGRTLFLTVAFFVFVLVVTLLSLYARWVCRHNRNVTSTPNGAVPAPPPPPQGLDPSVISSLPIVLLQPSSPPGGVSVDDCCICLGIFEEGDKVKLLPECNHYYHPDCVDRWLATHTSCPLCRASVRVDPPLP